MVRSRWRRRVAAVGLALTFGGITACGAGETGPPTLTWYINPDSGGQAEIAARCTEAAGGAYQVETTLLPRDAGEQRQQLVRRLAANDSSIDIMSLDPPYIPEFAEAGFLAPVPADVAARTTEGVVQSAVEGATWNGELVAVPFWANTQLLWYKRSVAEAAGLDMTQPVTWQQLIDAANAEDTQIAVQGARAESLTVWLNALVESAGGQIVVNPSLDAPENTELGLSEEPARLAAETMAAVAPLGGASLSTATEDSGATAFENGTASFMVNWPFVWQRALSAVEEGTMDASVPEDYGWAIYPAVVPGEESAPPYGGINLGIGAFSDNVDFAYQAAECITSTENQAYYFASNGNPAARTAAFSDPAVVEAYPMAATIQQSLEQAKPRPQTPYYSEVSESLQRIYHPPGAVTDASGPDAAALILAVLAKEELL